MSYAYLFKYIIIGDTGKWRTRVFYKPYFTLFVDFVSGVGSRVFFSSSRTNDFSPFMTLQLVSSYSSTSVPTLVITLLIDNLIDRSGIWSTNDHN